MQDVCHQQYLSIFRPTNRHMRRACHEPHAVNLSQARCKHRLLFDLYVVRLAGNEGNESECPRTVPLWNSEQIRKRCLGVGVSDLFD